MWGREWYKNISREDVLSPAMRQIWDHFGQGVVIVDGDGNCCYMNELQRKIDGFIHINIIGMHISDLYHAYEMAMIPTMRMKRLEIDALRCMLSTGVRKRNTQFEFM